MAHITSFTLLTCLCSDGSYN